MKVNLTKTEMEILSAANAIAGEVYLLIDLPKPVHAICLDESDEEGYIQFAKFDGTVCHIPPEEWIKEVYFAEVTIED